MRILKEFAELLAIPNVASDTENIERNADWIVSMLKQRGVEARLLESEGAPPLVYGELKKPGARRTVIFYAHYDGQPVVPSQWTGDPWHAVLREMPLETGGREVAIEELPLGPTGDVRLYARSTSDDKAPIIALLATLDFLRAEQKAASLNVKFLFEGEEEAGSPHLMSYLERNRELLAGDGLFICDGPVDPSRRMQLVFGARGSMGLEMTVYGPNHALHSGHYGNWAPNPIALLSELLAGLRDADGKILVSGFYDSVRPISDAEKRAIRDIPDIDAALKKEYGLAWSEAAGARLAERILLPALNFRGVKAGGVGKYATNAIPAEASASIDLRLVPDQKPAEVRRRVEEHIRQKGFHIVRETPGKETREKFPKLIKLEWDEGYPPYRLGMDDPFASAVGKVLTEILGQPPIKLPSLGGSVPMRYFADVLGVPVLNLPIANHDNNQHGPNENLRLQNLWNGIAVFSALLEDLGRVW